MHCLKSGLVVITVYSAHHSGLSIGIAIATVGRRKRGNELTSSNGKLSEEHIYLYVNE